MINTLSECVLRLSSEPKAASRSYRAMVNFYRAWVEPLISLSMFAAGYAVNYVMGLSFRTSGCHFVHQRRI